MPAAQIRRLRKGMVTIMARHGENIRKRKDGRWEGRYKRYHPEKEVFVYRSVYGRSYDEVKRKLTTEKNLQKESPAETGANPQEKSSMEALMFQDMAKAWLAEAKRTKKLSTYQKYSIVCQKYLEKPFKNTALSDITSPSVKEKISDHLSDSVQKSVYCVLNQILKYASVQYSVSVPRIQKPSGNLRNKPVTVLGKSELKQLFSVLCGEIDIYKAAVVLCLNTGLRLGEICALKWSDIDFTNRLITVSRTVQRLYTEGGSTKTVLSVSDPKSECSRREIPVSDAVIELLLGLQGGQEYVFGASRPMDPRRLQYHFKGILNEAGLPGKNFHILRHTFATNCIEGTMDVKSLSEILGHANVQITLNTYVHPSMDTKRRHIEHLSEIYGQNYGQAV